MNETINEILGLKNVEPNLRLSKHQVSEIDLEYDAKGSKQLSITVLGAIVCGAIIYGAVQFADYVMKDKPSPEPTRIEKVINDNYSTEC